MSQTREAIINSFTNPNPEAAGVFKMLRDVYPAFAKKLFQGNKFMEFIVTSNIAPMRILDYPICGRCETFAAYSGFILRDGKYYPQCKCFGDGCGATTTNPVTFKAWLIEEMRKKAPPSFAENCEYVVEELAQGMMGKYVSDMRERVSERGEQQRGMGLTDMYGNRVQSEHCEVTLTEVSSAIDLDEEAQRIGREENLDVHSVD